jgi:hypothetical protein
MGTLRAAGKPLPFSPVPQHGFTLKFTNPASQPLKTRHLYGAWPELCVRFHRHTLSKCRKGFRMIFAIAALVIAPSTMQALPKIAAAPMDAATSDTTTPTTRDTSKLPITQPATTETSGAKAATTKPIDLSSQNSKALAAITVPLIQSGKQPSLVSAERAPSRRSWLMLAVAEHSAAFFDAYSTRMAINTGAVERDPLMKPFANSPAIYGALQIAPVLFDFAGRKMQRSQNLFLRRTWWIPQTASTGASIFAGVHNIHVANRK